MKFNGLKKYSVALLLLFNVMVFSNTAHSAAHANWDWTNPNEYFDYNKASIPNPFDANFAVGLDTKEIPTKQQGWRLYIKRMECSDYRTNCTTSTATKGIYPFYILYNIYTGTLRHFIWVNAENYNGFQQFIIKIKINTDHGLLLHESEFATALSEKDINFNNDSRSVLPAYGMKWIIFDKNITYDPSPIKDNINYEIYFDAYAKTDVSLEGDFALKLSNDPKAVNYKGDIVTYEQNRTSSKGINVIDALVGINKKVKKYKGDIKSAKDDITEMAAEYETAYKNSTDSSALWKKKALTGLATFLATGGVDSATWLYSAYDVLKSFKSSNADPVVSMQYGTGSMTLGGSFINQYPLNFIKFGLHNSASTSNTVGSLLPLKNNLGLWSMANQPTVIVGHDFFELETNIRKNIQLNPESNMILASLEIRVSTQDIHRFSAETRSHKIPWRQYYVNPPRFRYTGGPFKYTGSILRLHNPIYSFNYDMWVKNRTDFKLKFPLYPEGGVIYPGLATKQYFIHENKRGHLALETCSQTFTNDSKCQDTGRNNSPSLAPISYDTSGVETIANYDSTWQVYGNDFNADINDIDGGTKSPNSYYYPNRPPHTAGTTFPFPYFENSYGFYSQTLPKTDTIDNVQVALALKFVHKDGAAGPQMWNATTNAFEPLEIEELRTYNANIRRVDAVKLDRSATLLNKPKYYCDGIASAGYNFINSMRVGKSRHTLGVSDGYRLNKVNANPIQFTRGSTTSISLNYSFSQPVYEYVWIDLNQDYQFDPATELFPIESALGGLITIPNNATVKPGLTKMRIVTTNAFNPNSTLANSTACSTKAKPLFPSTGNIQDFTVEIL